MDPAEDANDLDASPDASTTNHHPEGPQRQKTLQLAAWLLCPTLFVAACWALLLTPELVDHWLPHPKQSWLLGGPGQGNPVLSPLFALSKSPYRSWRLGYLAGRLETAAARGEQAAALLSEAATLLRVPVADLNATQLLALGPAIQELEQYRGPAARMLGTLSLVNLVWALAIAGIAISAGPALFILAAPLRRLLLVLLAHATALVVTLARALHPLWEVLAYAVCFYIIGAAKRYPEGLAGFIAVTGCLLAVPAFMYSTRLHASGPWPSRPPASLTTLLNVFLTATMAPVAITFSSQLIGFLASAALFGAVGFSVIPSGLCWTVGFEDTDTMLQATVTSAVLLSLLVALRALGVESRYVAPFQLGLSIWGAISMFLAGLIRTSLPYFWVYERDRERREIGYYPANVLYFAVICAAVIAGAILHLLPLQNTAITFLVLWVGEKLVENTVDRHLWVVIFGSSLALWQVALFLRAHPDWLSSLLQW